MLLSLQSLILVSDPLFNEPGYESIQETAEGEVNFILVSDWISKNDLL